MLPLLRSVISIRMFPPSSNGLCLPSTFIHILLTPQNHQPREAGKASIIFLILHVKKSRSHSDYMTALALRPMPRAPVQGQSHHAALSTAGYRDPSRKRNLALICPQQYAQGLWPTFSSHLVHHLCVSCNTLPSVGASGLWPPPSLHPHPRMRPSLSAALWSHWYSDEEKGLSADQGKVTRKMWIWIPFSGAVCLRLQSVHQSSAVASRPSADLMEQVGRRTRIFCF